MGPEDWPIAEDLYAVLEDAYEHYDREDSLCIPGSCCGNSCWGSTPCAGGGEQVLQRADKYHQLPLPGLRREGLLQANSSVKNAMLFNVLSIVAMRFTLAVISDCRRM